MEADQRGRSESNVGESNESTISASAGGSVDLRTAFGTVFNTDAFWCEIRAAWAASEECGRAKSVRGCCC